LLQPLPQPLPASLLPLSAEAGDGSSAFLLIKAQI
jgi:hypothetical protein